MIKLFNRSPYPDSWMRKLSEAAFEMTGCRGEVVVKIGNGSKLYKSSGKCTYTQRVCVNGSYWSTRGLVEVCPFVRERSLKYKYYGDSLKTAIALFKTFIHEFQHCREYQDEIDYNIILPKDVRSASRQRRGKHSTRPQEIRAYAAADKYFEEAKDSLDNWKEIEEILLKYAIEID